MELFERVKQLIKIIGIKDKDLAEELGLKQSTFAGYLNSRRQHNLWPLLPRILEAYPEISRQWLYFGEGPASFGRPYAQTGRPAGIRRIIGMAEQMVEDCDGNWGELLRVILGRAKEQAENDPEAAEKLARLEAELAEERALNRKLTARLLIDGGDKAGATDTGNAADGRG